MSQTESMGIPDEAVEAAEKAVIDAMIKHGPDGHIDGYQEIARAALEAAAPHMESGEAEFGVFRKDGDQHDAPMQNWTFSTREHAEYALRQVMEGESWLEIRSRTVTPWEASS